MLGIDQLVMCKVVEAPLMASDLADEGTKREEARYATRRRVRQARADIDMLSYGAKRSIRMLCASGRAGPRRRQGGQSTVSKSDVRVRRGGVRPCSWRELQLCQLRRFRGIGSSS